MSSRHILIVDTDTSRAAALHAGLQSAGHAVRVWPDATAALGALDRGEAADLVLAGDDGPTRAGLAFLRAAHEAGTVLPPVVLVAAHPAVGDVVAALQAGARDYLGSPVAMPDLLAKLAQWLPEAESETVPAAVAAPPPPRNAGKGSGAHAAGLVAQSPAMLRVLEMARRAAQTDVTVMLLGESGVGKEVLARYVHAQSPRAAAPFVAINCAAIPETLLEATLFGFEKGAFTGAGQAAPGKFEQAQGGTLLLDEVTEMAATLQAKLLRVLQEREIERLGGRRRIPLDLRIVATSNRDLQQAVREGVLREDVYYRLSVFPLPIPPLRERRDDVLPLARAVLARYAAQFGLGATPNLSTPAEQAMLAYDWPGNVRELDNVMQRAAILCADGVIRPDDLQLHAGIGAMPARGVASGMAPPAMAVPRLGGGLGGGLGDELASNERQLIANALAQSAGSKSLAAQRLGISPRTLRHKLQKLREAGLELPGTE